MDEKEAAPCADFLLRHSPRRILEVAKYGNGL
jgi:hypothetical protein